MVEFQVEGLTYRTTGKLDARTQFHVARRLAPVLVAMGGEDMIASVAIALGKMTDADADYVLDACLAKVQRQQGTAWASVAAPQGQIMFADMDMGALAQMVMAVLKEANLPGFFPTSPPGSPDGADASPSNP